MNRSNWPEIENRFEQKFKFNNYNEVVSFTNKVMQIAIKLDHHPEISVHFNFVKVKITDYEKGATSEKCIRFTIEVDKISV